MDLLVADLQKINDSLLLLGKSDDGTQYVTNIVIFRNRSWIMRLLMFILYLLSNTLLETVLGYHFAMVKKTCQIIGAYIALYPVLSSW